MIRSTIVSTGDLAGHLDGSWVIVDCRFDLQRAGWGRGEYLAAHVPTASYASLAEHLSGEPTGSNGRHPLPSIDAMAALFSRLGITGRTQVVAYDQDVGSFASRLWWMLRYLGHDAVAVLDGGWAKWVREGRPVRAGEESRAPSVFVPSPRGGMIADVAQVAAMSRESEGRLVDARAPERFEGRSETLDPAAGHIPGAVNHFFRQNATPDGTLLPLGTLREQFERVLGRHPPERTVMYCGSGVTACHNLLALEHAGLHGARLFPGSWSEWSADPARPIETGPAADE